MNGALLEVRSLTVAYDGIPVLEDVSFEVALGEAVGLVGESGAGKSTLARALVKLVGARRGALIFRGIDLEQCTGRALRALRRELQIIFQDPFASLDPRMTVGRALLEPLEIFEPRSSRAQRDAQIRQALVRVGLGAEMAGRYPRELSGGECQRVAIARALLPHPRLLICDEPVSALDVSIQGQVINLLADLNRREGMALLLISHNIALVRHLCGRIIVLLEGQVLEITPSERLPGGVRHPYTHALVAAVPALGVVPGAAPGAAAGVAAGVAAAAAAVVAGEARLRRGCVYARRCPHAEDRCRQTRPVLETVGEGHRVACHRWRELSAGGAS